SNSRISSCGNAAASRLTVGASLVSVSPEFVVFACEAKPAASRHLGQIPSGASVGISAPHWLHNKTDFILSSISFHLLQKISNEMVTGRDPIYSPDSSFLQALA